MPTLFGGNDEGAFMVKYNNELYDIREFAEQHPGGEDVLKEYKDKDVTKVMKEYNHSQSAYDILKGFKVINVAKSGDGDLKIADVAERDVYNILRFDRGLLSQMITPGTIKSREEYAKLIHTPHHLPHSAILFDTPFLEMFTKTPWYVIPSIWLPLCAYFFISGWNAFPSFDRLNSHSQNNITSLDVFFSKFDPYIVSPLIFIFGVLNWSLLEYIFHRFIFHSDIWLPGNRFILTFHFLIHGIHHFLPMDPYRLVMPPAMFGFLALCWTTIFDNIIECDYFRYIWYSGLMLGYVSYDLTHYFLHHGLFPSDYVKKIKSHHMSHHYSYPLLGFGITNLFWDSVFDTEIPLNSSKANRAH